jgi:hypothetical protein
MDTEVRNPVGRAEQPEDGEELSQYAFRSLAADMKE